MSPLISLSCLPLRNFKTTNMKKRLDFLEQGKGAMKPLFAVKMHLDQSPIGKKLIELVSFRVSQINGCAVCLDMHSKELVSKGVPTQQLFLLNAWRETTLFSEKERAALAWAEALTLLEGNKVPDPVYEEASRHFNDAELIDLTLAVGFINVANRLNIAFHTPVKDYDVEHMVNQLS